MTNEQKLDFLKKKYKDNEEVLTLIKASEEDKSKKDNWMEDLIMCLSLMYGLTQAEIDSMNA